MYIKYFEVPQRLSVSLSRSVASKGEVMGFGEDNDYPDIMDLLVKGSPSASAASSTYARFLSGRGFADKEINSLVVGKDEKGAEITALSLLKQAAKSVSINQGFYAKVVYTFSPDLNFIKSDIRFIPFKKCRFSAADESGYSPFILVGEWVKKKKKKSKQKPVQYHVYNPDNVEAQINAAGAENYKGQIYHYFADNDEFYPLSTFDPSYLDCDTERCMSEFRNNEIQNGMVGTTMVGTAPMESEDADKEFHGQIRETIGTRGSKVILYRLAADAEGKVDKDSAVVSSQLKGAQDDKLYSAWVRDLKLSIFTCAKNIPAILAESENGKMGTTTGEAFSQAVNIYNDITSEDRELLGIEMYKLINGLNGVNYEPEAFTIQPFALGGQDSTNTEQ